MLSDEPVANTGTDELFGDVAAVRTAPAMSPDLADVRWLFFAGNVVAPEELAQYADDISNNQSRWWEHGGMPCNVPGLYQSKYFIARCRFTPLAKGFEHIPSDYIVEAAGAPVVKVQHTPNVGDGDGRILGRVMGTSDPSLATIERFPGEYISSLLNKQQAGLSRRPQGLVELAALKGLDPEKEGVQDLVNSLHRFFFPEYPDLPTTLGKVEAQIRARAALIDTEGDPALRATLKALVQPMLRSCTLFRAYCNGETEANENWIRQMSTNPGVSASYWSVTETLMQQIDRQPTERMTSAAAPDTTQAQGPTVSLNEVMELVQKSNAAQDERFMTLLEALIEGKAQPVPNKGAQLAAAKAAKREAEQAAAAAAGE